jgi:gliding motility-associated-like protein
MNKCHSFPVRQVPLADDEQVSFIPGPASTATTTIIAASSSLVANGITTTTVTVQLKDVNGNNLTTSTGTLTLATTNGTISAVTDNGDGTYSATLTSSAVTGIATISGKLNGGDITDTETVNFTPRIASAATSTIVAATTSLLADGSSTTTITIQLKDNNGDNLTTGGDVVSLTSTLGTLSTVVDNGDGTYTAVITSPTSAGQATISGSVNGITIADEASVTFNSIVTPPVLSATSASADAEIIANGTSTTTITVVIKDQNNNPVTDATVAINTTAGTLSSVINNNDGTYTATLNSSITVEDALISFTVNSVANPQTLTVSFIEDPSQPPFFIPQGFSPDGDGVNDTFVIEGAEGYNVTLTVYNRWGDLVYESKSYKNDWGGLATRGIIVGEKLPDGTYFYAIGLDNGEKPYVRYMTIKRK